jgi:hypothetical protein
MSDRGRQLPHPDQASRGTGQEQDSHRYQHKERVFEGGTPE